MNRLTSHFKVVAFTWISLLVLTAEVKPADDDSLPKQAAATLRRAAAFFLDNVATEGGYLYRYSEDLSKREGERHATATTVWVQPPGTPSVGLAYLEAYRATGDNYYLDAAKRAAMCLVRGQLESGGWAYDIDFDPATRGKRAYRVDTNNSSIKRAKSVDNTTVLDDNTSQEALRMLMRIDVELGFKNAVIHEAALYGLDHLIAAQYPNGAWPQRFRAPPEADKFPVKRASYPESWSRTFPGINYSGYYTFNDNAMGDCIDVMLEAEKVYGEMKYRGTAEKCGDFILLAQMPDPQPAWAQQYDLDMHPAWARKFEPPSITGGESQSVLQSLLLLYRETGQEKFLAPVPKALAYFRASQLPDGQLARFYELQTNKPLYFTKEYVLTYSDADMPTHYSFKQGSKVDAIQKQYDKLLGMTPAELARQREKKPSKPSSASQAQVDKVKAVIAAIDDRGRWIETGTIKTDDSSEKNGRVINSQTFIKNVRILADYLAATRGS
jgi:PelA/Pel-15E family pectate lyase